MSSDVKEPVNFRLGARDKRAIEKLAHERGTSVSELIRTVVESYVAEQERLAWEAEARRASRALAEEAEHTGSAEARTLRELEAHLEEFAREWIWEQDDP